MGHFSLDRHSRLDSPVHRVGAEAKLAMALAIVLLTVMLPFTEPIFFTTVGVVLVAVAVISRIPPSFLIKRLLLLETLVLGVAALAWLQPNGGLVFAAIMVKSTICLLTMILLSNTTPFSELLGVLRWARFPALIITTLALMYRYLSVLLDETDRMSRARASRTFTTRRVHVWTTLGTVIGQLFIRSTERAERIYAAMCARGWK
jgi:cobalt/nickel transport system permease protein